MRQKSILKSGSLFVMAVMCLTTTLAVFLSSGTSSALAATAGANANNTALHERWTVGEDGKISAVYPESIYWAGDIEARATTGYLTYKLSENLSGQDEYYTSVTVSNIGDLNRDRLVDVQIMPWYVNNQNWVMFSIHAWTGETANVELVSKWFVNGESNGDNWQDNSCVIFNGSREEWNKYYSENTFTIWSRIKGDQVLFGIDTQTGDYQNNMQVYEPTNGRDWGKSNKYQGTFKIPGLADAMKAKWDSSYAGFDARRCSATFTDFVLTNDVSGIALNQAIAYAKFDIERYVSAENYYEQQWDDVQRIVSEAKTAFESVKDINSLNESVSGYQIQIGNVATKDETDVAAAKESLTWDAFCQDMEIDNVFRNFTLPSTFGQDVAISWQSSSSAIVIDGTTAKVTPSDDSTQSVTLTATLTKGEASDTKTFTITVPQSGSGLVEQAKEAAIAELDAIKNDDNFYNDTEWTAIGQIIEEAKNAINAADEIAEVNAALAKAKQDIGFITDKVNAKNEISAYAEAKGEENYWPDGWTEIEKIVTDAQAEIDKADVATSLQEIVAGAKADIDKVQAAVRTEGNWIINDMQKTYTGNDTASTIDDPQMQNIYLVDSAYKTGYKVSVTFTAKETNGRPGTRVGLIPWYVDENNYVSVYLSKSIWDDNAISLQIKAMLGGKEAFLRFSNVYDSTHALIDVDYTLTVLVEDDFVTVWYNDTLYMRADIAGIAAACAEKDVKIGMTVCNAKAEFRDLEQTEIGEEATKDEIDVAAAKESLTWDAFCQDMEIDNVFRNFTLPSTFGQDVAISWQSSSSAIVIDGTTAKVTPSDDSTQSVTLTATLTKGEASDTKTFTITVPQSGSGLVEQAKEAAIAELDAIKNDDNFYNDTEWTAIGQIIEEAKNAINAADEIAEVNAALAKAKQDIGFITDKVNAKNEISAYAEAKGEENYWPDGWTEIEKIVTDAQAEIDKADVATSLQEIVAGAKADIDKVQAAVRTEGNWIINDMQKTYTGNDTASTIDDPQMQNIYLVDSAYKTGYKVSVTFTAKETNGRPGTRVGLIPWYVDENNYVSVYLSKSIWDDNAISLQIKAMLGGKEAFLRFSNVYDSTHALIDVDYTLTVLVEDDFVTVWYNDTLYMRADIAGIAAACAEKDVKIGMTVCNAKAEFRDLEQTEIGEEAEEGIVGDYTVKGSGEDFWSVSGDGAGEVIVGDDSGNIGNDSWMAYYAVKQFNASGTYLVGADMKLLASSPLVNGKVGLVPLFANDNNWVAVYLSESSADGQIMMRLLVKLGGEIVCNESKAIYPATEMLLNVSRTFSVYVSGDTVVVWLEGSKDYVIGEKVGDLSALFSFEKLYYGVSIIGAKAEFSGLNVLNITSETVLDPNFAIALTRYELDSYKNQDDYYAEEWSVIKGYIADVINAMEDTGADIDALIADAKVKIDQVNTKTQVDAINAAALASKAAAAEAELDAYFSAKNSDEYADESWAEMRKTIEQAKAALAACTSEEEINAVVVSAKEDIDAFMKLPAPAPLPTDDGEAAQGLTTGEIVAIVFTAVFLVAAVCGFILTFTKFRRGKRQ